MIQYFPVEVLMYQYFQRLSQTPQTSSSAKKDLLRCWVAGTVMAVHPIIKNKIYFHKKRLH